MKLLALLLLLCLPICGCSLANPRPLTFEEQEIYMAKQQCAQAATAMNPEWPNSDNPIWSSYFVMCMHELGIPDSALAHIWY